MAFLANKFIATLPSLIDATWLLFGSIVFSVMRLVYYLDFAKFYLSHVLTKFLIVGKALCTKNQSYENYLDCVKSSSEP